MEIHRFQFFTNFLRFLGIKQSLFLLFDKIRQNKTISDNISHSVTGHYIVKLVWKKLCVYDIMVLGTKQFVPRTKRDVAIKDIKTEDLL